MLYWIWLTQINGLGPKRQRILLQRFNKPENIYRASLNELMECDGIGQKTAEVIIKERSLEKANRILENAEELNIKLLTLKDPLYPVDAKSIEEMPTLLYYRGNLIRNSMGVAIVGARRCSEYGKIVTDEACTYLAKENICVISGMAKGVDGYAHTSCIKAGGYTIAVLGNGLDICYPPEHMELMEKIIENGAVISEYPPGTRPEHKHFPRRNLIIAAWAYKILVIEAGEKSGSLITANYSKQYKREVFAVPDNIYRRESMGSNRLIYSGAKVYIDKKQLLIDNRYKAKSEITIPIRKDIVRGLDDIERKIIKVLKADGSKTIEELSTVIEIDITTLIEKLSIMELENKITIKGSVVAI